MIRLYVNAEVLSKSIIMYSEKLSKYYFELVLDSEEENIELVLIVLSDSKGTIEDAYEQIDDVVETICEFTIVHQIDHYMLLGFIEL